MPSVKQTTDSRCIRMPDLPALSADRKGTNSREKHDCSLLDHINQDDSLGLCQLLAVDDNGASFMWHHPWHGNNGWPVVIVARPGNSIASAHRAIAGEQYTIVSDITSMSLPGYGVLQCDTINCLLPNTQSIHPLLACLTSQPF
jgi:hypothetical protein